MFYLDFYCYENLRKYISQERHLRIKIRCSEIAFYVFFEIQMTKDICKKTENLANFW